MDILDEFKSEVLSKISYKFLLEKHEIGSYKKFNYPKYLPLLRYNVDQYKVHNMGNLAILQCRTTNIINLLTVIITPDLSTNIPFIIIDFIKINNKWTIFFEFYDEHTNTDQYLLNFKDKVINIKNKFSCLEDYIEEPHWYVEKRAKYSILKCGKKNQLENAKALFKEVLCELIIFMDKANKPINTSTSKILLNTFIEDLINKGTPASIPINKALGKQKGEIFFEDIIFYFDKGRGNNNIINQYKE